MIFIYFLPFYFFLCGLSKFLTLGMCYFCSYGKCKFFERKAVQDIMMGQQWYEENKVRRKHFPVRRWVN